MEKEENRVQSASTVTKQQSNKSACALRSVNPCSAIVRSGQRSENTPNWRFKIIKVRYSGEILAQAGEGGGERSCGEDLS